MASADLYLACMKGQVKVVRTLLEGGYGKYIDTPAYDGNTPLSIACLNGRTAVVSLLLDKGAKVNLPRTDGWSALMAASLNGHSSIVKLLMERGAQVNMQDNNRWSALMAACKNGHTDTVELLIEKGAQVNVQDTNGWSALMAASLNGHTNTVKLLIEKGAHVNMQNNHKWSALFAAVKSEDSDTVILLIENNAEVDVQNNDGWTALMLASRNGRKNIVERLIEKSAQVDIVDNKGWSALMAASQFGHSDIVKLLIDKGAAVNLQNKEGWSALIVASKHGCSDTVKLLIEKGAQVSLLDTFGRSALDAALYHGKEKAAEILRQNASESQAKCDLSSETMNTQSQSQITPHSHNETTNNPVGNRQDTKTATTTEESSPNQELMRNLKAMEVAETPSKGRGIHSRTDPGNLTSDNDSTSRFNRLFLACKSGQVQVVKTLLEHGYGKYMDAPADYWFTPLIISSYNGHIATVKLLLDRGANVNIRNDNGCSALMAASLNGYIDTVKLLIEKGAQINIQNSNGTSALLAAGENGHSDTVNLLLEKGAQVNMPKNDGASPLMLASMYGHSDNVKLLLERGAQVNMQDNDGGSALIAASQNGHSDVVRQLIDKGAQLNIQNYCGRSALSAACFHGRREVAQILIDHHCDLSLRDTDGKTALGVSIERGHADIVELLLSIEDQNACESTGAQSSTLFEESLVTVESRTNQELIQPMQITKDTVSPSDKRGTLAGETAPSLSELVEWHHVEMRLLDQEVNQQNLLKVSRLLEDWREFARAAGLTEPETAAIHHDEPNEECKRFKSLDVWHKKNAFLATYKELLKIMLSVGRANMAGQVCKLITESENNRRITQSGTSNITDAEHISEDIVLFMNNPIGSGAFGVVFRGEFNHQPCAIKLLRALADEIQMSYPVSHYAPQDSVERFSKECEYLESFHHPNVVRHLATRTHPRTNHLVLALELMDCNLRHYFTVKPGKPLIKLSLSIQTRLCHDIASALEYIHSRGVVHRDLCSDNILLACGEESPIAKVCDFGMSRIITSTTKSISLQAFAHKGFMPPEATDMESSCYNSRFDIFSFGALMVQIVRHLQTIKDRRERNEELDLIEPTHPIKVLINKCLQENRDNRPSASQLKRRLNSLS